jgi:serine/threonine protein kinase
LEIITKEYPYAECSNQAQIYKKVSSGIKPLALSRVIDEASRAFVELCLNFDPENRPSALELLSHPFLSDAPMMSPESSFDHIAAFSDVSSVTSYETTLRNEAPSNSLKHIVDAEHHTFLILERPTLSKAINNSGIPDSHCVVEYVDRPSEHEVTLKMLYGAHGAPISEIRFPFKLLEDTAEGVVAEMIKEALIAKQDEVLAKMKLLESLKAVFYGPKRGMNNEGVLGGSPLNSPLLKPSATPYHLDLSGKTRAASLPGSVNLLENSLNLPGSATGSPVYPTPWNTLPRASTESTKDEHFPTPASCQSSTSMDEAVKSRLKELQELNLQGLGSMDAKKTSTINRHRVQPILGSGDSHQWPITFGQNSQSRSQSFVRQSYSTRLPSEPTIGQLAAHQRSQSSNSSISGITNISTENLNFDQLDHIEKS